LTKLQKKYGDKVAFVGITDEDAGVVAPFVEKMGSQMDYTVVAEGGDTYGDLMEKFGVGGTNFLWLCNRS
jgi:hypothetical protein